MASWNLELKSEPQIGNCSLQKSMYMYLGYIMASLCFHFCGASTNFHAASFGNFPSKTLRAYVFKMFATDSFGLLQQQLLILQGLDLFIETVQVKIETYLNDKKTPPDIATTIQVTFALRLMHIMARREQTTLRRKILEKPCFPSEKRIKCVIVFVISLEGRLNRRNKAAYSNCSAAQCGKGLRIFYTGQQDVGNIHFQSIPDTKAFSLLQDYRYYMEICCYALQIIALEAYYVSR